MELNHCMDKKRMCVSHGYGFFLWGWLWIWKLKKDSCLPFSVIVCGMSVGWYMVCRYIVCYVLFKDIGYEVVLLVRIQCDGVPDRRVDWGCVFPSVVDVLESWEGRDEVRQGVVRRSEVLLDHNIVDWGQGVHVLLLWRGSGCVRGWCGWHLDDLVWDWGISDVVRWRRVVGWCVV